MGSNTRKRCKKGHWPLIYAERVAAIKRQQPFPVTLGGGIV